MHINLVSFCIRVQVTIYHGKSVAPLSSNIQHRTFDETMIDLDGLKAIK